MPQQMSHPRYGARVVPDVLVDTYSRVGWQAGAAVPPPVVEGSVKDVLAAVGDDVGAARRALEAEQSRPEPRTSLVTALARIAAPSDTQE